MNSKMIKVHLQIVLAELLKEQDWIVKTSEEGLIFYLPDDLELFATDHETFYNWTNDILTIGKIDLLEVTRFDYFQNDKWLAGIFLYPDDYEGEIPDKR